MVGFNSFGNAAHVGRGRRSRHGGLLLAATLAMAACGGGDDESGSAADGRADAPTEAATDAATEAASDGDDRADADASDGADMGNDTGVDPGGADDGNEDGTASSADPAAASMGNGTLPGDLCAGDQFVGGAIDTAELIDWGVFTTPEVTIDGGEAISPVTYTDFGVLCNLDGDDFLTASMRSGRATFDELAELLARGVEGETSAIGDWEIIISPGLTTVAMAHTGSDGSTNELWLFWSPADAERKNLDEVLRVFGPVVEAIATRTTVDAPTVEAPGVADWFACTDTDLGVAGLSPAALYATLDPADDIELEIEQDINASFGFTTCTARSTADFRNVSVRVQDSSALLQDTLDSYLAGWPEAVEETIAGTQVALNIDSGFGTAEAFTVVDGTPLFVSISADTSTDYTTNLREATALVLSSIG